MTAPYAYPSGTNTFVPNFEASGKLSSIYVRNPTEFALPRYVQYQPVSKPIGLFRRVLAEEGARLINANLDDFAWPDGGDAPTGEDGLEGSAYFHYETRRRMKGFRLGDIAFKAADYEIGAESAGQKVQQLMTARTQVVVNAMLNTNNYNAAQVLSVPTLTYGNSANQGTWMQSTTGRMDIKRSLNAAFSQIKLATNSCVKKKDVHLVIGYDDAGQLAETQEIVDYIKGSPAAIAQVRGSDEFGEGFNSEVGLPNQIYGFDLVVEDTVKVTSRKNAATTVKSYVMGTGTAAMISRPGALQGTYGAPSFSTLVVFVFEDYDMLVEQKNDMDNKRQIGRVIDMVDAQVLSPLSGCILQNIS